jgi:DNA ligase-associated metallophosphoesterase
MTPFTFLGEALRLDAAGALWWPAQKLLAVADLHFEKGSSFAARGVMLPPYDTRATLLQLGNQIRRYDPAIVVCLGDSFHDRKALERLPGDDLARLTALAAGRDWIWVEGNHDLGVAPPVGRVVDDLALGPLLFRHIPATTPNQGEIAGHFHPKARVATRAGTFSSRCFVTDGRRLVLPAFGAFTGGLDVLDPEFPPLFPRGFRVLMAGRDRLHLFPRSGLLPVPGRGDTAPENPRASSRKDR